MISDRTFVRVLWTGDLYSESAAPSGPKAQAFKPDKDHTISLYAGTPGTPVTSVVDYPYGRGTNRRGLRVGYCTLSIAAVREKLSQFGGKLRRDQYQEAHGIEHWAIDTANLTDETAKELQGSWPQWGVRTTGVFLTDGPFDPTAATPCVAIRPSSCRRYIVACPGSLRGKYRTDWPY